LANLPAKNVQRNLGKECEHVETDGKQLLDAFGILMKGYIIMKIEMGRSVLLFYLI